MKNAVCQAVYPLTTSPFHHHNLPHYFNSLMHTRPSDDDLIANEDWTDVLREPPNTACSRQVGLCAFYRQFSGFGFILLSNLISSRPLSANASR